jgi:hypothetical protein
MNKVKLEFQHFHGCPNGPKLKAIIDIATIGLEDQIEFSEILVESNELASKIGFRGSPTLLINGNDTEGQPAPESANLSCRFYPNGLPTPEKIRELIQTELV